MSQSGYVHLDFERIEKETENAFLVVFDGESHWIPKSQIADAGDYEMGDEDGTISVTEFIARERGIMP